MRGEGSKGGDLMKLPQNLHRRSRILSRSFPVIRGAPSLQARLPVEGVWPIPQKRGERTLGNMTSELPHIAVPHLSKLIEINPKATKRGCRYKIQV